MERNETLPTLFEHGLQLENQKLSMEAKLRLCQVETDYEKQRLESELKETTLQRDSLAEALEEAHKELEKLERRIKWLEGEGTVIDLQKESQLPEKKLVEVMEKLIGEVDILEGERQKLKQKLKEITSERDLLKEANESLTNDYENLKIEKERVCAAKRKESIEVERLTEPFTSRPMPADKEYLAGEPESVTAEQTDGQGTQAKVKIKQKGMTILKYGMKLLTKSLPENIGNWLNAKSESNPPAAPPVPCDVDANDIEILQQRLQKSIRALENEVSELQKDFSVKHQQVVDDVDTDDDIEILQQRLQKSIRALENEVSKLQKDSPVKHQQVVDDVDTDDDIEILQQKLQESISTLGNEVIKLVQDLPDQEKCQQVMKEKDREISSLKNELIAQKEVISQLKEDVEEARKEQESAQCEAENLRTKTTNEQTIIMRQLQNLNDSLKEALNMKLEANQMIEILVG